MVKEWVTISEFARRIGISRQRVHYACQKGKITFKIVDDVKRVDFKFARKEWEENKNQTAAAKNPSGLKKVKAEDKPGRSPTYDGLTTADAERKEKVYKAKLSQLKYKEQSGELINAMEVEREAFEIARKTRDLIMLIPGRVASELAAETDPHKLEHRLTNELQNALQKIIKADK